MVATTAEIIIRAITTHATTTASVVTTATATVETAIDTNGAIARVLGDCYRSGAAWRRGWRGDARSRAAFRITRKSSVSIDGPWNGARARPPHTSRTPLGAVNGESRSLDAGSAAVAGPARPPPSGLGIYTVAGSASCEPPQPHSIAVAFRNSSRIRTNSRQLRARRSARYSSFGWQYLPSERAPSS